VNIWIEYVLAYCFFFREREQERPKGLYRNFIKKQPRRLQVKKNRTASLQTWRRKERREGSGNEKRKSKY